MSRAKYFIDGLDDEEEQEEPLEGSSWGWTPKGKQRSRKKKLAHDADSSLSDFWGSRFGGFGGWFGGSRGGSRSEQTQTRVNALSAVRRVGSIIFGGNAKQTFGFGSSTLVTLDHTLLDDTTLGWSSGRKVDALMGNALAEAGMRKHGMGMGGYEHAGSDLFNEESRHRSHPDRASSSSLRELACTFGRAANWIRSTQKIVDDFPGYSGYFDTEREFRHNETTRASLQQTINEHLQEGRYIAAASMAALWNSLCPENPLETPFAKEVDEAASRLREGARTAKDVQYLPEVVKDALRPLLAIEEPPPPEQPPQEDSGEGEGEGGAEGQDPSEEADDSEGSSGTESPPQAPKSEDALHAGKAAQRMAQQLGLTRPQEPLPEAEAEELDNFVEREMTTEEANGLLKAALQFAGAQASIVSAWQPADKTVYQHVRRKVQPLISRTRESLKFRNELARMDELGLTRGLLDEGGLSKIAMGDSRVFRRQEIESAPNVHLGLLVDESGSMGSEQHVLDASGEPFRDAFGSPILVRGVDIAQQCAVLLQAACEGLPGVSTSVWGHSANGDSDEGLLNPNGATLYRYLEKNRGDVTSLGSIRARANNLDGFAIAYAGKRLLELANGDERKVLIVLADGLPAGRILHKSSSGYLGSHYYDVHASPPNGVSHTAEQVRRLRAAGISVFLLGMGGYFEERRAREMYGDGNYQLIANVSETPRALSRLLERALRKGSL